MTPGIKAHLYAGSQRVFRVFRELGILNILFYINHKSL